MQSALASIGGLGFIFIMTCAGAATVFFFRKSMPNKFRQIFLGFAAGVMISASVWSLLIPAIEEAEKQGLIGWIPAAGGFILGILFLLGLDYVIPHLHPFSGVKEGPVSASKRTSLLIFAVTLHNIPEGMAVGLSFAFAAQHDDPALYAAALALALGVGIQNFPEGAAVALPLRQEGLSTTKSFLLACLSGAVEPVFGIIAILLAVRITPIMPWLLSFAAGAMIYVVVEEIIPEAHLGDHSHPGTLGVMAGFLIMMVLEVAMG